MTFTRRCLFFQQLWSLPIRLPNVGLSSDNWRRPMRRMPNLILCGTDITTDKAIAALMPTLFKPIYLWWSGMPLSLQPKRRGTLILLGLAGLSGDQQKRASTLAPQHRRSGSCGVDDVGYRCSHSLRAVS